MLARCRKLSSAEPNKTQYEMRSRKHRQSLRLFGYGKDTLNQFSRLFEIMPIATNVRQRQERLHQLGIVA